MRGFESLDDGGGVEVGGEADQGPGDGVPNAGTHGLGDGAVELDATDGQAQDVFDGGEAGAEVAEQDGSRARGAR